MRTQPVTQGVADLPARQAKERKPRHSPEIAKKSPQVFEHLGIEGLWYCQATPPGNQFKRFTGL